jgi:hypothetical protein
MKQVLELYRDIRRLHRKLPPQFKYLGNQYVIQEFRLHRAAKPEFVNQFLESWNEYRDSLAKQLASSKDIGKAFEAAQLDDLTPQQLGQLYELKKSTKHIK